MDFYLRDRYLDNDIDMHITSWHSPFVMAVFPGGGGVFWVPRWGVQPAAWKRGRHAFARIPVFLCCACRRPNPLQMDDVWAHSATRRIIMTGLFAEREREKEGRRRSGREEGASAALMMIRPRVLEMIIVAAEPTL